MRALALLVLLPVLPLALAHCDSPGGGGGGPSDASITRDTLPPPANGPPVEVSQYCERFIQLACDSAVSCGCLDAFGANRGMCRVYVGQQCAEDVTTPVASGAMRFDATRAGQCLAALRTIAADCLLSEHDVLLYVASHCEDFVTGARTAGQPCADDDECVDPLRCDDVSCYAPPIAGEPCRDGSGCADDHYCDPDDVCRAEVALGGPCGGVSYACRDDLHCDSRSDTCQPEIAQGQPCGHATWACQGDHYCDSRSDTCQPEIAQGQPCGHATWACRSELRCDATSALCAPYPGLAQPCTPEGECADDFYCDASQVCRRLAANGAMCSDDDVCASDHCEDDVCGPDRSEICTLL